LEFEIDGMVKGTVMLGHRYSRGLHYPRSVVFAHDLTPGEHTISLTLSEKGNADGNTSAARILQFCVN
jgi:hypothetical protein